MKSRSLSFLLVVSAVGCGGGGGSEPAGGTTSDGQFGPVTVRMSGRTAEPLVTGGGAATVTSVFGAAFSEIRYRRPAPTPSEIEDALGETNIAYSQTSAGTAYFLEVGTGKTYPVTNGSLAAYFPSISSNGEKIAVSEFVNGVAQVVVYDSDATNRKQLTTGPDGVNYVKISPDGTKVVFMRKAAAAPYNTQIMVVPTAGGATVRLTSPADINYFPSWSPDGTKIVFTRQVNATGLFYLATMNADGTGKAFVPNTYPSSYFVFGVFNSDGTQIVYAGDDGFSFNIYRSDSLTPRYQPAGGFQGLSASPVGNRVVFGENGGLSVLDFQSNVVTSLPITNAAYPYWGPYVTDRRLVGIKGPLGATAGGFSYSLVGKKFASFVSYDAQTLSTLSVTPEGSTGSENVVLKVEADKLTSLKYVNQLQGPATTVVANLLNNQVRGALVAFDSQSGDVASVVTYSSASATKKGPGGSLHFEGAIVGAWDRQGKNLAPSGARSVSIDRASGELRDLR
jgi:hypothetical protein